MWFQGLQAMKFGLNLQEVKKINIFWIKLKGHKFEVEFPQWKFGKKYTVQRLPVFVQGEKVAVGEMKLK
jgi:hypothetical protein